MTDPYRALCAELVDSLHKHTSMWEGHEIDLVARARALLDQPVAEGPTDDKLMDIARATDLVYYMGEDCGFASPYMEGTDITAEVLAYARAVLAKWGAPMTSDTRDLLIHLVSHMSYMQGQLEAHHQYDEPEDYYWYRESVALRKKVQLHLTTTTLEKPHD